jgi:hypothetical protein
VWDSLTQSQAKQAQGTRQNLEEDDLERSRLVQHAFEENRRIVWKEAKFLEIETNSGYRK